MRQADINRVKKAKEHLKAAMTILSNIKWENTTNMEYDFTMKAKETITNCDGILQDIITIQDQDHEKD